MMRGAGLALLMAALATGAFAQSAPPPVPPAAPASGPASATPPSAADAAKLPPLRPKAGSARASEPAAPPLRRPPGRSPDPALTSPSLATPVAPRLDRRLETAAGGAQCRTRCAQSLYLCDGEEGGDHCTRAWSQCVLACPSASAGPL